MLPLRDDQPRYSAPWVTWFLIALNLLIFFFEAALDPDSLELLIHQFGVVPSHLPVLPLKSTVVYPRMSVSSNIRAP